MNVKEPKLKKIRIVFIDATMNLKCYSYHSYSHDQESGVLRKAEAEPGANPALITLITMVIMLWSNKNNRNNFYFFDLSIITMVNSAGLCLGFSENRD